MANIESKIQQSKGISFTTFNWLILYSNKKNGDTLKSLNSVSLLNNSQTQRNRHKLVQRSNRFQDQNMVGNILLTISCTQIQQPLLLELCQTDTDNNNLKNLESEPNKEKAITIGTYYQCFPEPKLLTQGNILNTQVNQISKPSVFNTPSLFDQFNQIKENQEVPITQLQEHQHQSNDSQDGSQYSSETDSEDERKVYQKQIFS